MSSITQRAVDIATGYRLGGLGFGVQDPVRPRFYSFHVVQIDSGAHLTSYPIGTAGSFPRGKSAGA
jgi:hypothetical protein